MAIGEQTSLTEPNRRRDERDDPVIPVNLPHHFLVRSYCDSQFVALSHERAVGDIEK